MYELLTEPNAENRSARVVRNVKRAMLANPAKLWLIDTNLGAPNGHGPKWARETIMSRS